MDEAREFLLLPQPRRIERTSGWSIDIDPKKIYDASIAAQGYRILITKVKTEIFASEDAGFLYANQTLHQLRKLHGSKLPCCLIEDWPDFPARGVMLDVSRDKVPTMATLFALIDQLASWKINQIQLYIEHTFGYRDHKIVWENASPFSADEIQSLDRYCRERFIDLVPNQNSFGHMERWLKHEKYRPLAEAPDGAPTPWGFFWEGPFSLCPTEPKSLKFLAGLYDELLPNFSSQFFNVGCDETFDIGAGASARAVAANGVHEVYFEFLQRVHKLVTERGRRMMFWGDVIRSAPEQIGRLAERLPGAIALVWDYEAKTQFNHDGEMFAAAGVPFYVCPGTSSWCSIAGRTDVMLANVRSAARDGLCHGAIGFLMTDWGDYGHVQYLPASMPGFVAGAALSWCAESNEPLPLAALLDRYAFDDEAAKLGQIILDLGNVYQHTGSILNNASSLFRILIPHKSGDVPAAGMTRDGLDSAEVAIDTIVGFESARPSGVDGVLIVAELKMTADLMRFAIALGRSQFGGPPIDLEWHRRLIDEHRRLWLARNRPGGLEDSVARLAGAVR